MDPVTHALVSATLDRAGLRRVSASTMLILVVSGTAADLDLLSYAGGASAYFHYHNTVLHSILGSAALAVAIAAAFCIFGRGPQRQRLRFGRVLLLCAIGAGIHLLLDCLGAEGVQLFWPFHVRWFALDLLPQIDPWILGVLLAGLLLPALFRMVSEEIGERRKKRTVSKGAAAALVLMVLYIGWRSLLHQRAVQTLMAHDYHGAAPLGAGAFPDSVSPFLWRGVVATSNTVEQISVPVESADEFHADSSLTNYKPEDSLALDVARRTLFAKQFLQYARFPLAELQSIPNGSLVTLRDLRFPPDADTLENMRAVIELDGQLHVRSEEIEFAGEAGKPQP
ncbi:MAG: metal-dependent hydrolase [Candidatus Acidiferrales bacterium]